MTTILSIFLIILLNFGDIQCDDGLVTIWAPDTVFEGRDYTFFYLPANLTTKYKPKLAVQFRKKNITIDIKNDESLRLTFPNKKSSGKRKKFDLFVTFYRTATKKNTQVELCITRNFTVESEKKQFYTFIQTDKPIYKPGDEVKFRVLVVDRDMKPYHMNNIHVSITDPLNRSIKEFKDLDEFFLGVFSTKFSLNSNTPLGDWKIRVVVDKMQHYEYSKVFGVQKYTLPEFNVKISTEQKHMLTSDDLQITFHAQYAFGESVTGNAKLIIVDPKSNKTYLSESFDNIIGVQELTYDITNTLKITTDNKIELEATISFSEPESSYSVKGTTKFYVHGDSSRKIRPVHDEKFVPGLPFYMKVYAYEWNGDVIESHSDLVFISYTYTLRNNQKKTVSESVKIVDALATFNHLVPKNAAKLSIEVTFSNSQSYRKIIEMGAIGIGKDEISIDFLPKNPKLYDVLDIFVKASIPLDIIVVIVMTRYGNSESKLVNCNGQLNCEFDIKITKEMIPKSTIRIYFVKDKGTIYFGRTNLTVEEFGDNYINIELPSTSKTKDKVNMKFSTKENSRVYLLAYDKRLTYLMTGNNIETKDVVTSLSDFEDASIVKIISLKTWKTCTADEIKRVKSGIVEGSHSGSTIYAHDYNDEEFNDDDDFEIDTVKEEAPSDPVEDDLRENFPENWIFDDFEVGETESIVRSFTVPDSLTSWMISTFSVNKDYGFAIAPTKELPVKNELFMKMIIPYSIRFNEVFRLDILVHNYANDKSSLDVKVDLYSKVSGIEQFEFIEYQGDQPTVVNSPKLTKSLKVLHSNLKKVSFFIRPQVNKNREKGFVKLYAFGNAKDKNGKILKDKVQKKLRVESAGVKIYDIHNKIYELDGSKEQTHQISVGNVQHLSENSDGFPKMSMAVAGDFLTDTINMDARFEFFPSDDIEQKTSKLKGNVEFFRYLVSTSKRPATTKFSDYYQSLLVQQTSRWRHGAPAGYRAYFVEAISSAMEIGALPANMKVIHGELDALKRLQTENGDFNDFGDFPEFASKGREETAKFFQTAFTLIPFLKFRGFISKKYDDVINKGFDYLNRDENRLKTDNEGLSIAAYAYALNGNFSEAQNFLNEIENDKLQISDKQRCLKISKSDNKCDIRHTSYAAIAYFSMNNEASARPLINWLLESHNLNKYYSNSHSYAIATEAISKLASTMKSYGTNFTVTFKNEANFTEVINIVKENGTKPVEIEFPEYSLSAKMIARGYGHCSVTTIVEKTITLSQTTPNFKITIKTISKRLKSNEKIIRVCAAYEPPGDQFLAVLTNVIYDVEIQSGFIYQNVIDFDIRADEIKMVMPKQKGSKVLIYFHNFVISKQYCVDIEVKRAFEVRDAKDAGVKVYDFNDKQNVAIKFYKL